MIRAVLFDLDGTIVESPYDWPEIKRRLGTGGRPVLDHLEGLPEPERSEKRSLLESLEAEATRRADLKEGMAELLGGLTARGVRIGLVTNNSRANTDLLLRRFGLSFECVITRDSGLWKPSGAPLAAALDRLGVQPAEGCAVGDSLFDVQAALEAGLAKVFLLGGEQAPPGEAGVEACPSVVDLSRALGRLLDLGLEES